MATQMVLLPMQNLLRVLGFGPPFSRLMTSWVYMAYFMLTLPFSQFAACKHLYMVHAACY